MKKLMALVLAVLTGFSLIARHAPVPRGIETGDPGAVLQALPGRFRGRRGCGLQPEHHP